MVKRVKENLTKTYPLAAMDLVAEVQRAIPGAKANVIWDIIRDNGMKDNPDYSAYNFRNKKQEDGYHQTGKLPSVTPSIYNQNVVDFVVKVLQGQEG